MGKNRGSVENLGEYGWWKNLKFLVVWGVGSEMGSIEIHVSAMRIARYFCIDIGIALATFESIVYRYRLTHILRIGDTSIADTSIADTSIADTALRAVEVFLNFPYVKFFHVLFLLCRMNSFDNFTVT